MNPTKPSAPSLPKFNDAVLCFRGYPRFYDIPEALFGRIAEIVVAQGIALEHARERISEVIWEDEITHGYRHLSDIESSELRSAIREEVSQKLKIHL